ncbi:type II toxin-antitoxin system RelE/ParE family toxin [Prevotella sp. PINT]|jgi:Phage-related protein|uniref:type II toxin-antitoxin system RelE/ParE family toxin n=1 Tax=Palleniella intestinalis TaxID=2736291 RepID=UPI0015576C1B|nr:type II toxin-antitoxin system RelE/ParE family toxin [Palleniella intestinalis]NPD81701.1 type II toxin-antitoxin system RelE/ParE family toxin [Palleniella intestinalis]
MARKIKAFGNHFYDFVSKLSVIEQKKVRKSLLLFSENDRFPRHFVKYIEDGIYEFRVTLGNNEFRIFFIYDGETLVILFNAFRKKTQKTPRNEIERAKRLKVEYYEQKDGTL